MQTAANRTAPAGVSGSVRPAERAHIAGGVLPLQRGVSRRTVRAQALIQPEILSSGADLVSSSYHHAADLVATVADAATAVDGAAVVQASEGGGPFDAIANVMEGLLEILDSGLENAGVPYSYGFSIILLTVLVKAATYPLTKKQVESTVSMQALQPAVKDIQARYANDAERLQMETARLYKDAGVNPLAGCLPTLATIPVFIGLYRALTKAADDGLLSDSFFWIPSLGGPTSVAERASGGGLSWLFPLQNGAPPIGWHDAGLYLILPVLLTLSQWASQKIIAPPKTDDPAQQQSQAILKFIPLMIGWFSLNVPSGLTLYWFTNNILTTAQQVYLKRTTKTEIPKAAVPQGTYVKPVVDVEAEDVVKKPTGQEMGSRRKGDKGEKFRAQKAKELAGKGLPPPRGKKGGKKKKGDKFKANKAKQTVEAVSDAPAAEPIAVEPEVVKAESKAE